MRAYPPGSNASARRCMPRHSCVAGVAIAAINNSARAYRPRAGVYRRALAFGGEPGGYALIQ